MTAVYGVPVPWCIAGLVVVAVACVVVVCLCAGSKRREQAEEREIRANLRDWRL
jgi:hypothetical protein